MVEAYLSSLEELQELVAVGGLVEGDKHRDFCRLDDEFDGEVELVCGLGHFDLPDVADFDPLFLDLRIGRHGVAQITFDIHPEGSLSPEILVVLHT